MATDAELAARIQTGDADAFTELYERYVRPVYDFVARTVRDLAAAEDITQAAFLRAWAQREQLKDSAAVKSWLYRIAHNLALNHVTRRHQTEDIADHDLFAAAEAGPEASVLAGEASQLVWDAAASLEPRQYAVLELAVRQQLTTAEIAGVLDVDNPQASLLVHRAKDALGNAVRYLLVARRRTHCDRLAEMVPAGVRQLTPELRASVDRHMRRCEDCRVLAQRVTEPGELFGGLALLPLPQALKTPPHLRLTGAHTSAAASAGPEIISVAASRGWQHRLTRRWIAALIVLLLLLIAGSATAALMLGRATASPAPAPVITPLLRVTPIARPTSTASPTSTPTTTAAAVPVTPAAPTATPPAKFGVSDTSLCFVDIGGACNPGNTTTQSCKQVGFTPSWTCAYKITFTLTPGTGGTLHWAMATTLWTNCFPGTSAPINGSGTAAVASPAPATVTVTGSITVSSEPNPANWSGPTSTATVTSSDGPHASHNTVGYFGHLGNCS